jgi:hypothetical protein
MLTVEDRILPVGGVCHQSRFYRSEFRSPQGVGGGFLW